MGTESWEATCKVCGHRFEVGLWRRDHRICGACVAEWSLDPIPLYKALVQRQQACRDKPMAAWLETD